MTNLLLNHSLTAKQALGSLKVSQQLCLDLGSAGHDTTVAISQAPDSLRFPASRPLYSNSRTLVYNEKLRPDVRSSTVQC